MRGEYLPASALMMDPGQPSSSSGSFYLNQPPQSHNLMNGADSHATTNSNIIHEQQRGGGDSKVAGATTLTDNVVGESEERLCAIIYSCILFTM